MYKWPGRESDMYAFQEVKLAGSARPLDWTDERIKQFWDWENQFPERYFTYHNGDHLLRFARTRVGHGGLIVDFGAGSGILFEKLLRRGFKAAAVEISKESLATLDQIGKSYPQQFKGAFSPEAALKRLRGKCDVIYLVEVIEHLDAGTRKRVLRDVYDLLSLGGHLILTTPNDERLEESLIACPVTGEFFHRWQHMFSFTVDDISSILSNAGFSQVEVSTCYFARNRLVALGKYLRGLIRGEKKANLVAIARK
jgi:2-polyprenyl-3-methyl-5-hydroxy-6-metoxy-1,4-benzoquinol methylase